MPGSARRLSRAGLGMSPHDPLPRPRHGPGDARTTVWAIRTGCRRCRDDPTRRGARPPTRRPRRGDPAGRAAAAARTWSSTRTRRRRSLGTLGRPFDRRHPFFVGLSGAFGVAVAYVLFRGIADITSVLVIVGLALFIAIGLNPIIDLPDGALAVAGHGGRHRHARLRGDRRRVRRRGHPAHHPRVPRPRDELPPLQVGPRRRQGVGGRLAVRFHLTGYLTGSQAEAPRGGWTPRRRPGTPVRGRGHGERGRADHLLPHRPTRGEEAVAVADRPQPT